MKFADARGKRVVFVAHCLLNQGTRAPGAAYRPAASAELIRLLLDYDLNIEQLPCPECIGLGGVSRRTVNRFLPLLSFFVDRGWYNLIAPWVRLWQLMYAFRSKREARHVVDHMEDLTAGGFEICGLIGVDDSPSCGVMRTLDVTRLIQRLTAQRDMDNPVPGAIRASWLPGRSFFVGAILDDMENRGLRCNSVGLEPWVESHAEEAQRVIALLNLESDVAGFDSKGPTAQ